MIDSKKAAELAAKGHPGKCAEILAEILAGIEEAATEGYHSVDYYSGIFAGHNDIANYVIKSLQERSFGIKMIEKGIQIDWGLNTLAA